MTEEEERLAYLRRTWIGRRIRLRHYSLFSGSWPKGTVTGITIDSSGWAYLTVGGGAVRAFDVFRVEEKGKL